MTSISIYQPHFFDCIESPIDSTAGFYEVWASWYWGGRVYKVVYVEGEGYKKIYDDAPGSRYREIALNVIKLVFFPLTVLAIVFKLIYRSRLSEISLPLLNRDSNISNASQNLEPPFSSSLLNPVSSAQPIEENQNLNATLQLIMHLFREGLLPGVAPVQTARNLINHIEETHLNLPDVTALGLLKELMRKTPPNAEIIAEVLPIVQRQVEEVRKAQQEASKNKELRELFSEEFNDCVLAAQIAEQYQIDYSCFTPADFEFIGTLTCFFIIKNKHEQFKDIEKEIFIRASDYLKNFDLNKNFFQILVFDLAKESDHETSVPQEEMNNYKLQMGENQKNIYELLKSALKALQNSIAFNSSKVGDWKVSYREVWGTILKNGMGFH
jgi:hypothetical protein